jgi:adenylate kinase family enzyme
MQHGKRISVCGPSGAGKSTLGRALARQLDAPFIELDSFNHLPDWKERPVEQFRELVDRTVQMDCWVIDGNYAKVRDLVWARADTIIWLDYPLAVTLSRVTKRTINRWKAKELLWGANRESGLLRFFFNPKDSLFWWVIKTHRRRRRQARELITSERHPDKTLLVFRSPEETNRWLSSL